MQDDINKACEALRRGGIILYPTDTIWGIGCDATNEEAVKRVFEVKQRADSKAMIVLLDSINRLQTYVVDVPETADMLIEVADKPLTIIYPKAKNLAKNLVADDGSIAIRITGEAFSNELCRRFGKPIVSTSANISGQPFPASFAEIDDSVKDAMDYIVSYRQDEPAGATPSGIIKLNSDGSIVIIRE